MIFPKKNKNKKTKNGKMKKVISREHGNGPFFSIDREELSIQEYSVDQETMEKTSKLQNNEYVMVKNSPTTENLEQVLLQIKERVLQKLGASFGFTNKLQSTAEIKDLDLKGSKSISFLGQFDLIISSSWFVVPDTPPEFTIQTIYDKLFEQAWITSDNRLITEVRSLRFKFEAGKRLASFDVEFKWHYLDRDLLDVLYSLGKSIGHAITQEFTPMKLDILIKLYAEQKNIPYDEVDPQVMCEGSNFDIPVFYDVGEKKAFPLKVEDFEGNSIYKVIVMKGMSDVMNYVSDSMFIEAKKKIYENIIFLEQRKSSLTSKGAACNEKSDNNTKKTKTKKKRYTDKYEYMVEDGNFVIESIENDVIHVKIPFCGVKKIQELV